MASFYAELRVAGRVYVVRRCSWEFTQATDTRGRVVAKVRHGKVYLTLDVPDGDLLVDWAATPYKPLPGCVVFFQTKGAAARETVSWEAGNCVGYREEFQSGSLTEGAYVCHLVVAAPKLVMSPGGPSAPFVAPTPRGYAYVPVAAERKANWKGGAGPDGMGDAIGKFSGRLFDPDNCGGPIIKADWHEATISAEGIEKVQTHISRYGADSENDAMVERLQKINEGSLAVSDWDRRFYTHELREYERYQAMGVADGIDPGREVWNSAHTATLEDFGLADYAANGSHNLYHPEI